MLRIVIASSVLALSATGVRAAEPGTPGQARLLRVCREEKYTFTPKVREAFLSYAKEEALANLEQQGKSLPEDLLAWVDADPVVAASVYGAHHEPADVLLWLCALRLDLGKARFEEYRQLALATAIVSAKLAEGEPDITPRKPLELAIPGDPRTPVDTKQAGRELDKNDHIINFLNANTIEEEIVVGHTNVLPELKYDERGIAIPAPKKGKARKVPITEKRTRTLYAADVLAGTNLQQRFNAYMKSKGQDVQIDCGERIVHWKSRDMVRGEQYKKLNEAYLLFRGAYEAKGLLPAERDPFPSPGERCAYLIRNNEYAFTPELQDKRKWPRFPQTAPWPVLTMLAANNQPLREREERWIAFRDKGEFKAYGEYIGGIAQQHPMQSARRLKPYPFTYGTIQMMLKDGGVCGTMGAISARSHCILGIPASQASQPGHCAMVAYRYDPKSGIYSCKGGQYATGGDDKTTPFVPWFGEKLMKRIRRRGGYEVSFHQRKPMVYHQSVAWAVNYGVRSYVDSTLAHAVFRSLPEAEQGTNGLKLLESGLALNPYNFLLVDAAQTAAATPQEQIAFWKTFRKTLAAAAGKPGCPTEGLYPKTVRNKAFARIAKLPVPEDKRAAGEVLAFLEDEKCSIPAALVSYRLARDGLDALLTRTERDFTNHLGVVRARASRENDAECKAMSDTFRATADRIKDRKQRKEWAQGLWAQAQGHEKYFGHNYRLATNPAVAVLARYAGRKLPPEKELVSPVLERVAGELKKSVTGDRDIKTCRVLAAKIKATGSSLKDADMKRAWLQDLAKVIEGKESFKPANATKKTKPLRDPCADTIKQILGNP
jgi:hypothetical protein